VKEEDITQPWKVTVIQTLSDCQTIGRWMFAYPFSATESSERYTQEGFQLHIFCFATEEKGKAICGSFETQGGFLLLKMYV
jgi:hypothetical protein